MRGLLELGGGGLLAVALALPASLAFAAAHGVDRLFASGRGAGVEGGSELLLDAVL